jgi:FKBP-type peptidyl-prolyl cis-trans isomerase 2
VLAVGKGTRKPHVNDIVSVHYRIKRVNGDELTESGKDSKSPTEIKVGNVKRLARRLIEEG